MVIAISLTNNNETLHSSVRISLVPRLLLMRYAGKRLAAGSIFGGPTEPLVKVVTAPPPQCDSRGVRLYVQSSNDLSVGFSGERREGSLHRVRTND